MGDLEKRARERAAMETKICDHTMHDLYRIIWNARGSVQECLRKEIALLKRFPTTEVYDWNKQKVTEIPGMIIKTGELPWTAYILYPNGEIGTHWYRKELGSRFFPNLESTPNIVDPSEYLGLALYAPSALYDHWKSEQGIENEMEQARQ